uniref:Synaptonemal complex protein 1 n=1 Tax=Seriola dumerili TaxID=41447 RepID=A0A3B4VJM4_SERDU
MERNQGFNFKLLVPPRLNNGQVCAVRPQEIVESCGDFMNTFQQGYSRCFDKGQNMPFPNTSLVTPTKPIRQGIFYYATLNNCNPGQLCSKLFEEVEKMKCWKVKVDSDTVQKERRLQENKRTIETQRKAIQELQFGNENLSIKLEEQISENEDLRNKNNATRNLCNILKDTCQRSAKNMQLFESEREETHHLVMENSESIQKLIAAFESLRILAEADQQEMQKVKEGLLQFEELKEKYCQEYAMKEEEVAGLQIKLKNTESGLEKVLLDLHETQKHCKQLQETTNQQNELLKSSKAEQESLLQQLHTAEQSYEETQVSVLRFLSVSGLCCVLSALTETLFSLVYFQNKILKKQITKEIAKSSQLENVISSLHDESQNLEKLNEEIHQKLLKDLEYKSTFAAELENEVIKLTAAEAIKNKEDAELKCQHKIADMVALMEKHKSQYDRIVEEKDAELDENKKKEKEAVSQRKSLELDLSKHKTENEQLKKQLKTETTKKENLQKELTDLKKEMSSMEITQVSEAENKQVQSQYICKYAATDDVSYRIRTPPSAEKAAHWGKSTFEFDPKSDSSDQNDLLVRIFIYTTSTFIQIQSPVTKSPGSLLKLAAMKRMRDAGWTAVTRGDKKKKKNNEKIFA